MNLKTSGTGVFPKTTKTGSKPVCQSFAVHDVEFVAPPCPVSHHFKIPLRENWAKRCALSVQSSLLASLIGSSVAIKTTRGKSMIHNRCYRAWFQQWRTGCHSKPADRNTPRCAWLNLRQHLSITRQHNRHLMASRCQCLRETGSRNICQPLRFQ